MGSEGKREIEGIGRERKKKERKKRSHRDVN